MAKYKKNARGYYRTGVTVGYDENGKMIRKYVVAKTISELEKKIMEIKIQIGAGMNLLHDDELFGDYARMWFNSYKVNCGLNTRAMYEHIITKRLDMISGLPVKDIKPIHLQNVINEYSDLPRTCEQIRMTLRQIFNRAIADGLIVRNPAADIELPRHIKKEKRALTNEEKAAVMSADLTDRERAFIMIAYGCGLRPGEIYVLTWEDIDLKRGTINVNKTLVFEHGNKPVVTYPKTDKSIRLIETPRIVLEALRVYRGTNIIPRLFTGKGGEYLGKTGYAKEWLRIKKKIETELGHETDLTLYCFRHNFCTDLYYSGVSMKEAQRLMGHSDYKMIMEVYSHLDSEKEDTRSKLEKIFNLPCDTSVTLRN